MRLRRSETNLGFGGGCNLGARLSRGHILVFVNPDTEARPGWLDALLAGLEATPGAGLATAKLLLTSHPDRIDAFGNDLHISGIPTCHGWGEPASQHQQIEEVAAVSGACFAISRKLFDDLGRFDERLFLYYEDDDLSLRARLAGYSCIAIPNAVLLHDHSSGVSAAKLQYLERNRWFCLLKTYRWRTIAALMPALLLAEALVWLLALRSGPAHVAAKARAWGDLLRWGAYLGQRRSSVQRQRVLGDKDLLRLHGARLPVRQLARGSTAAVGEHMAAAAFAGVRRVALALVSA